MTACALTVITTCKGRLHHLKQTLPRLADQPQVAVVVVDYGCPDGTAAWVSEHFPQVRVVREEVAGFCLARARNLGAQAVNTPWLAFFDADVLQPSAFLAQLVPQLKPGLFYLPRPADPACWGSCIVPQDAFRAVEGYDEAIDAWGGEDNDLYDRLRRKGLRQGWYPGQALTPIRHSDAERMRFYGGVGNIDRSARLSHLYRLIKGDHETVTGKPMAMAMRQPLRRALTAALERASQGLPMGTIRLPLPERPVRTRPAMPAADGPKLRTHLTYELTDYPPEQTHDLT